MDHTRETPFTNYSERMLSKAIERVLRYENDVDTVRNVVADGEWWIQVAMNKNISPMH